MKISDWRAYFEDRGLEAQLIDIYIKYAGNLLRKKLPVIFEFEHLSLLLEINREYLARMVAKPERFYREFSIPKRTGGRRRILAPYESLLACQRWILSNILYKLPIHYNAHGFVRGSSIKSNAEVHIGGKALLKMDLKDFFPSIPQSWVIKLFLDLGYAHNVAYYLSALCCHEERLAQGAATSPALSNILLRNFDKRLTALGDAAGLRYTRYADDITFSGEHIHPSFSTYVSRVVDEYGLTVNDAKTRLKIHYGARLITGVSISSGKIAAPRTLKREIKNEVFFIKKFGLLSHLSKKKAINPNYLQKLLGRISFWLFLEPFNEDAHQAKLLVLDLMKSNQFNRDRNF